MLRTENFKIIIDLHFEVYLKTVTLGGEGNYLHWPLAELWHICRGPERKQKIKKKKRKRKKKTENPLKGQGPETEILQSLFFSSLVQA